MSDYIAPFQPGEAVYHVITGKRRFATPILRSGVVMKVCNWHVTVQWNDGKRSTTRANLLAYVGCCIPCAKPAMVVAGALICPLCDKPAHTTPPPEVVARLFPNRRALDGYLVYHIVVSGLVVQALWNAARNRMRRRMEEEDQRERDYHNQIYQLGVLFAADTRDDVLDRKPASTTLPTLTINGEVDQEPGTTTNDALADWLEGQMKRKAA